MSYSANDYSNHTLKKTESPVMGFKHFCFGVEVKFVKSKKQGI